MLFVLELAERQETISVYPFQQSLTYTYLLH